MGVTGRNRTGRRKLLKEVVEVWGGGGRDLQEGL